LRLSAAKTCERYDVDVLWRAPRGQLDVLAE
jgi:hypothetical protein